MPTSKVTLTTNPLFRTHLSVLRDQTIPSARVRSLVNSLSQILTADVLSSSSSTIDPSTDSKIALVPILRSGLAMTDAFLTNFDAAFPDVKVAVYHLGLFREKNTLQPVEYYNKLPVKDKGLRHAYVLDPLLATGGTAVAAISILQDWGVDRVTFITVLASKSGLEHAASVWPEGVDFVVGAVDDALDSKGYVQPGVGDIGDRLYGTSLS
ncbi:MAG: hypothetical protein M1818_007780 [Claussenomyces sp. TS43310]|nr:MAG: hypothetical protein M1818_007780 [Claussenomyces sp. TS43310]